MKKLISIFLMTFMAGVILTGCGKTSLTDMVDKYEFCGVEDDIIYWDVYFKSDCKTSEYDYEDFIDVIEECMSRSGHYSFSDAWILAFDNDGINRFVWNSFENPYVIEQKDGSNTNLRTYEWNLTSDEVREIWDSIGYKELDDEVDSDVDNFGESEETVEDVSIVDGEVSEDYYWQSFYINPKYDKYEMPASENGLEGTLVQIEGKITDIKNGDDMDVYYLTEENGNIWIALMYNDNPITPEIGEEITAYGEYEGLASNYDEKPYVLLLRYISGEDMVKITAHYGDISNGILYPGFEGYPVEYLTDVEEEVNTGFYHYTITLSEWDDLSFDKQCSLAKNWVEYYEDLFSDSGLTKNDFDIIAYDENGNIAFTFNGGEEVEVYRRNE